MLLSLGRKWGVMYVESLGKEALALGKPGPIIGMMNLANMDFNLTRQDSNLGSNADIVREIASKQSQLILKLQELIYEDIKTPVESIMELVTSIEKNSFRYAPLMKDLPDDICSAVMKMVGLTFKLRSSCMRMGSPAPASGQSKVPSEVQLVGDIIKINLEMNVIINCPNFGTKDPLPDKNIFSPDCAVRKICDDQNDAIQDVLKLFQKGIVSEDSVIKFVLSMEDINARFVPLIEFLPDLHLKLLEMEEVIFKLRCVCYLKC